MKKLLFIFAILILFSCKKEEPVTPQAIESTTYCLECRLKLADNDLWTFYRCGTKEEITYLYNLHDNTYSNDTCRILH
jgi:hypothetical protein